MERQRPGAAGAVQRGAGPPVESAAGTIDWGAVTQMGVRRGIERSVRPRRARPAGRVSIKPEWH